ncbi:hypothetical protein GJ496_002964 [Pomphorhynchus laevis]|nr:hypothetical protein GJ496_002964 [Pomphorhynchus laevis]
MDTPSEKTDFLYALSCRNFQLRTSKSNDLSKKYLIDCCRILDFGFKKGLINLQLKDYLYDNLILNNKQVFESLCKDSVYCSKISTPANLTPEILLNLFGITCSRAMVDMEMTYGTSDEFTSLLHKLCSLSNCKSNVLVSTSGDQIKKSQEASINLRTVNKDIQNPKAAPATGFCTARGVPLKRQKSVSDDRHKRRFVPPFADKQNPSTQLEREKSDLPKNVDPKLVDMIMSEIVEQGKLDWDEIAGLHNVKQALKEIVIWPLMRPDLFVGLRGPPKGLLLFGPPGTGKTLIGRCIASQSNSKFFSISASSLTSKWEGEGEKLVRTLFTVAANCAPSVIFVDEIDSLLTRRRESENEATRRIKTEFLVQMDGICTKSSDQPCNRVLLVGATNRPQELDEAARRRFTKRLYVPLPDSDARKAMIEQMMSGQRCSITNDQIKSIVMMTNGYSGADMSTLCSEAAMGPIRRLAMKDISQINCDQVEPVSYQDFENAVANVKASVSQLDLGSYKNWNVEFGSFQYSSEE